MLTDATIRTQRIPELKPVKLRDGNGLYLEVTPKGAKYWRFRFWIAGRERLMSLGVYPAVSLKQARILRDKARGLIAQGVDPAEARAQAKGKGAAKTPEAPTFEAVAREWHAKESKKWAEAHAARIMGRMVNHLFPALGSSLISELKPLGVYPLLKGIEAEGKHETAQRLRQYIEGVFTFAIATGRAERNVGMEMRKSITSCRSTVRPALTDPEAVGGLLRAIRGYDGGPVVAAALKLAPLTFTRPGELRQAEWSEFAFDDPAGPVWVIPAHKTKMRKEHVVPLSPQAVEVLEDIRMVSGQGRYVFPCNRTSARPMSDMTVNAALRRMGYDTRTTHCGHGFRAMASTMLHEAKWPTDAVERQLAHAEPNTTRRVYDRAEHLPERRRMMDRWADYLDRLAAGDYTPLTYSDT